MSGAAVEFDVNAVDPASLAGKSVEELEALAIGQPATPSGEGKPEDKKPEGEGSVKQQATEKKDVQSASSGAAEAAAAKPDGSSDKEHNFAVMRAANRRMQQELAEAQRKSEELQQQLASAKAGKDAGGAPPDLAALDKQISDLRTKADEIAEGGAEELAQMFRQNADVLAGMRAHVAHTEQQRKAEADAQAEAERKSAEDVVKDEVQATIDANPVLSHWQANDLEAFNLAADQDAILRSLPAWKDKPMAERFAKAVEMAKDLKPDAAMPQQAPPQGETKTTSEDKPKPAAAAPAGAAPVRSLSDVPGGLAPAKDQLEQVAEMSAAALGNKLLSMTREQQDAYLASLG